VQGTLAPGGGGVAADAEAGMTKAAHTATAAAKDLIGGKLRRSRAVCATQNRYIS
jgi:hypothetical protein